MNYSPSSRDAIDEHCREVIRSCLNIVEQHGDTYVAIHKDDDIECIVLVSMIRSYSILSIIVADKLLLADINEEQMHSIANELNLVSVTGWHSVFLADDSMIYMYRQCLWLSMSLTYEDLLMTILSSTPLARSTVRTGSKSILALRKVNPIMRRNLNMKLNRLLTLYCALSMALGMVTFASAADYSFKTSPDPVYYGSTNYEDLYDAEYRYGSRNQIDYDIPEIQYGLSQEFLESSLNNPYLNGNTQYGFGGSSSSTQYPESDFGSSSIISGGGTIEMPYEPSVTLNDLKQSDGSIGQVSIDRVGLNCKVYEGATDSSMSKGAGHYSSSGLYTGNVGLFGHNRGNHPYFGKLKNVKDGDIVKYKTAIGTKTYKVTFVGAISYTDFSYLNEMGDNRITLITCIANQPSLRLCVQAVEIR